MTFAEFWEQNDRDVGVPTAEELTKAERLGEPGMKSARLEEASSY